MSSQSSRTIGRGPAAVQRRALALAAGCRIDGERFTVRRLWERTPDLSGPERLAVFGALPPWAQDDFWADVAAGGSPQ